MNASLLSSPLAHYAVVTDVRSKEHLVLLVRYGADKAYHATSVPIEFVDRVTRNGDVSAPAQQFMAAYLKRNAHLKVLAWSVTEYRKIVGGRK